MLQNPYTASPAPQQRALTPEEEASLLSKLGGVVTSGLSTVGNLLDVPGSMVRDTLGGRNPFDQLLHPFSHGERGLSTSGRDLLAQWGAGENKATGISGWGDDPSEAAKDIGGFGLEIALDPLSWLTFGAAALGKGGKVVKAAGAGKMNALKRMKTTVSEAASGLPRQQLEDAAKKAGFADANEFLAKHGDEAMGGLVGVGTPFGSPKMVLGKASKKPGPAQLREVRSDGIGAFDFAKKDTLEKQLDRHTAAAADPSVDLKVAMEHMNKAKDLKRRLASMGEPGMTPEVPESKWAKGPTLAERLAEGSDRFGKMMRYGELGKKGTGAFSPGQQIARLFGWKEHGVHAPEMSKHAHKSADAQDAARIDVRKQVSMDMETLEREGLLDDDGSSIARQILEGTLDPKNMTPKATKIAKTIGHWRGIMDKNIDEAHWWGVQAGDTYDPTLMGFVHRVAVGFKNKYSPKMGREKHTTGIFGGTEQLREMIRDPKILEGDFNQAYEYFQKTYAPTKIIRREGDQELIKTLVQRIRTVYTPEQRASGVYARNFLQDIQDGTIGLRHSTEKAKAALEGIVEHAKPIEELSGETVTIRELLPLMKMNSGVADPLYEPVMRLKKPSTASREPLVGLPPDQARTIQHSAPSIPTRAQAAEIIKKQGRKATEKNIDRFLKKSKNEYRVLHGEAAEWSGQGFTPPGLNTKQQGALFRLREMMAAKAGTKALPPLTYETMYDIGSMAVPKHIADDLVRMTAGEPQKMAGPILGAIDSFMNLFKVGVLTHPARFVRDRTSGVIHNMLTGNWSLRGMKEMHQLLGGEVVDFTDIPVIQRMMKEQGLEATAENSTSMMRQLFYTYEQYGGSQGAFGVGESAGVNLAGLVGRTADFRNEMVGRSPISFNPLKWRSLGAGTSWNPLKVRGVMGETETANKIFATGERISRGTDALNRGENFITNLRRGKSADEAAQIVNGVQVNYAPHTFTEKERDVLKRVFPFYAFTSRMTKHVIEELAHHPGGGTAQAIRAQAEMSETDLPQPAYVGQAGAIPVSTLEDGTKRYLTSLGLMHEDPLSFLGGTGGVGSMLQTAGLEMLSRTNPLPKALVELATGEQFFQRGLTGGRELGEADPTLGRLLTNIGLREEGVGGRATPVLGTAFEHALANSPISRLLSTARTLTDPRKATESGLPGPAALLSTTTGLRVTDVSPAAQDVAISQRADRLAKEHLGGRSFSTTYIPKELIERARKRDPELAGSMDAFNQLNSVLDRRGRKRRKAEEAKKRMGLATGP